MEDRQQKVMVTVKEFSELTGISVKHVRTLTHIESFPCLKVNGWRLMIHRVQAEKWLQEHALQSGSSCLLV